MQLVDLTVTLVDLPYAVTRRLTVPAALRLTDLHLVLQAALGWENSHMYDFSSGRSLRWSSMKFEFGDPDDRSAATSTLADVLAEIGRRKSFTYTYDMGDSWEHDLVPSKPRDAAAGEAIIALHDAVGRCPPEDSGGAPGFGFMLDCLADPESDEYQTYVEWLSGPTFDRTANVALQTKQVAAVAKRLAKRYQD